MRPVDYKFVMFLSSRLQGFVVKNHNPFKANFRCIMCGDSKTKLSKKRGWIIESSKGVGFHCFNCSASMWLGPFIEHVDPHMFADYLIESKLEWMTDNNIIPAEPEKRKAVKSDVLSSLKKVSQLPADHPVKFYIEKRKIPSKEHYRLLFAPKFNAWVNTIVPDKLNADYDEPRLVIPFLDDKGKVIGFTGRSFKKDGLRYCTIMLSDETKCFGLDKVNFNEPYSVCEGPLDSLFLPNCIASADASLTKVVPTDHKDNATLIFDNESRNSEIVRHMKRAIDNGFKVCIWPSALHEKDVNDMVVAGHDVKSIIERNTYKGLEAAMRLSFWQKT